MPPKIVCSIQNNSAAILALHTFIFFTASAAEPNAADAAFLTLSPALRSSSAEFWAPLRPPLWAARTSTWGKQRGGWDGDKEGEISLKVLEPFLDAVASLAELFSRVLGATQAAALGGTHQQLRGQWRCDSRGGGVR